MSTMVISKTNEKILIWMNRNGYSGQFIAEKIGITRQAWAKKMKDNIFSIHDILTIKSLGFED